MLIGTHPQLAGNTDRTTGPVLRVDGLNLKDLLKSIIDGYPANFPAVRYLNLT